MKLRDKYAVVTGASTGIGRAIAIALAREGSFVALVGRSKANLLKTKSDIEQIGGSSEVFICDLAKRNSIELFIESIKQNTDKINILVNVAGVWHGKNEVYAGKDFDTFPQQVILDTYSVGLTAPTLLAHAFIPLMPSGASIVNISETFEDGAKGWLPYFVSKRGIEDFTVGLAEELEDKNIKVNAISPSDTATQAYKKYFPEYIDDAIDPKKIGEFTVSLCTYESIGVSGKVFVMKKNKAPYEGYHV